MLNHDCVVTDSSRSLAISLGVVIPVVIILVVLLLVILLIWRSRKAQGLPVYSALDNQATVAGSQSMDSLIYDSQTQSLVTASDVQPMDNPTYDNQTKTTFEGDVQMLPSTHEDAPGGFVEA